MLECRFIAYIQQSSDKFGIVDIGQNIFHGMFQTRLLDHSGHVVMEIRIVDWSYIAEI